MKYFLYGAFILLTLAPVGLKGQISDHSDVIIYKAPEAKFQEITLQGHKDLPRFGAINRYTRYGPNGKPMRSDKATMEKLRTINQGYRNYYNLIALKYMSNLYEDMDKERLTPPVSNENKTEKLVNSYTAQQHLKNVIKTLYSDGRYKNGFQGSNTFETHRNYKTFISEEFPDIQKWSQTFFEEEKEEGYLVSVLRLGAYDFDKNGYWVLISFDYAANRAGNIGLLFDPKTGYGEKVLKTMGSISNRTRSLEVFLPLSADKAEKLVETNTRNLYLVQKIELTYKNVQAGGRSVILNLNYHHKSPTMEIYEDQGLTKTIGSISLDNLVLKN